LRLHPGEVEATGWRVERLSDVVHRLLEAAPDVVGRPRLIAVDGRGGAGKSTLVERLRMIVPASGIVHTDDVAWNHAYFDWGALMVESILRPLHRGEAVTFRPPGLDRARSTRCNPCLGRRRRRMGRGHRDRHRFSGGSLNSLRGERLDQRVRAEGAAGLARRCADRRRGDAPRPDPDGAGHEAHRTC
jgi:hypothetical protein